MKEQALESRTRTHGGRSRRLLPTESCALVAGEMVPAAGTLAYAAPELVNALNAQQNIRATPAHDMWAIGVMAYEALSFTRAFPTFQAADVIAACAAGRAKYVWEGRMEELAPPFAKSRLCDVVLSCLARNPDERPTAQQLRARVRSLGEVTTTRRSSE
jgi:serine/threonine protein kinase